MLALVAFIATGWWLFDSLVAPESDEPADSSFAARLDAYLEGNARAELIGGAGSTGPSAVAGAPTAGIPAQERVTGDQPGVDGLVVDETAAPVPGARVEVLWHPPRAGDEAAQIERVVKTARDGTFRVPIPTGGFRRLRVIEQDTRSADPMSASELLFVESGSALTTLRVQRAPNLGGKYVDEEGKPRTYKRVLIFEGDYVKVTHVETNWEGRFEVRVRPDLDFVHVKVGKLVTDERSTRTSALLGEIQYDVPIGTRDLLLTSHKPRLVTCTVRGSDGAVLRIAQIWAKRVDENVGSYVKVGRAVYEGRRARRRPTGEYQVRSLRPGEYSLFVDPRVSGYARSAEVRVRVPSPRIEVVCPVTAGIHGTVRGAFRESRTTVFWDAGDHPLGRVTGRARVSRDGTFLMPGAPDVAHRLFVQGTDGLVAALDGVMPGDEDIELTLEPGLSISGTVMDPKWATNGWVAASQGGIHLPVRCDEKGRFEIKGLTAGDWDVHLYILGVAADQQPRGIRVATGTKGVRLGD